MPFFKYPAEIKLIYVNRLLAGDSLELINSITGLSPRQDTLATWIRLWNTTRNVLTNPAFHAKQGTVCILSTEERNYLLEAIEVDPTLYLNELAAKLAADLGIIISVQTLQVELRERLGLTLKVARTVDPAQDQDKQARFLLSVSMIPVECFIFFGETSWP